MSMSSSLFLKNSIVYFIDITTFIWAKYFHFKKVLFYTVYFLWLFSFLYGYLYLRLSLSVLCLKVHCPFIFIQFSSVTQSCLTLCNPWIAACQASLSITISWSSLKLTSIESVMPSSHLILRRPLLLLPPIPPSIRLFSNESTLRMRRPKYWSFSFSIIPFKEIPGLIFRMDWLDLLAVQRTLKSLRQYHSSKASILQCSAFFTVQLSHPYMTTGKIIPLTRRTFVGKVMSASDMQMTPPLWQRVKRK